jgi:hypothetical protein
LKLEPDALKAPRGGVQGRAVAKDRKAPPIVKLSSKKIQS